MSDNTLHYGDNLSVLRESVADESVDLIYLDPPFNSNATYNVLFKAPGGEESQAQIEAFGDTWHWNEAAEDAFDQVMRSPNSDAASMLQCEQQANLGCRMPDQSPTILCATMNLRRHLRAVDAGDNVPAAITFWAEPVFTSLKHMRFICGSYARTCRPVSEKSIPPTKINSCARYGFPIIKSGMHWPASLVFFSPIGELPKIELRRQRID